VSVSSLYLLPDKLRLADVLETVTKNSQLLSVLIGKYRKH